MQIVFLKRSAVQLGAAVLLLAVVFMGYGFSASSRAESRAREVCAQIPNGISSTAALVTAEKLDVDPRLKLISSDGIAVGFEGAFLIEKWFCNVRLSDGKVVESEVRLLD